MRNGGETGSERLVSKYMVLSSTSLLRHQQVIDNTLREIVQKVVIQSDMQALTSFYGQMRYHFGWIDANFTPIRNTPGKLLRPTLLLLAYEAAGAWGIANGLSESSGYLQRALPAAAALELTHNFTLIHDDIEDGDTERRHRSTLWKLWGVPQAINTGDGMFALSRLALWDVMKHGVEAEIAVRLAEMLDRTILIIAEGQHLDISFETYQNISVSMYLDMISRKTAALMECAAEMGALLGTRNQETIARLRRFGKAMGVAFQVRDDLLGVWATTAESGKTSAGDVYRRKKSLPTLHALEHASSADQQALHSIYQQDAPITQEQVEQVLAIFERTETRNYCHKFLAQQCQLAYEALAEVSVLYLDNDSANPISVRALDDMKVLVHFVEEAIGE